MIAFPQVNSLLLENLPSLVSFGSDGLTVQWPSLEDVTVNDCPKIQALGQVDIAQFKSVEVKVQGQDDIDSEKEVARIFQLSDKYSSIAEFNIDDNEELSKTLAVKLKRYHFTNLLKFQAKNCNERLNDFLSILLKRSDRLEHLTIKECKTLKYVFAAELEGEGNGKLLAHMKTMILEDLPQLTYIWKPIRFFELGCLEEIKIMKCSSLKYLFSIAGAENLQQLQVLILESCEMLEEVVAIESQGLETQTRVINFPLLRELVLMHLSNLIIFHRGNCALEFPSLKILRIKHCPQMFAFTTDFDSAEIISMTDGRSFNELSELDLDSCGKLKYVIPSNILPEFQSLIKLTVNNCDSLEVVFQIHGEFHSEATMLPQLSELVLTQLPNLQHVINREFTGIGLFQNLKILRVKGCNSLKYLFLPFVAGSLRLEEIEISNCSALEEILVTKEETSGIMFSNLKFVAFDNLPKLSAFYLGTFEFPSLERLNIANCPALKTFVSGPRFHRMKDLPDASNNFFINFESLEKLKELIIRNQNGVDRLWHYKLPLKSFCELEVLNLSKSHNLLNVIPSNMLIRYNKLKSLIVDECELLKEVFDLEDGIPDYNATEFLPQIEELILTYLPNLEHVWNKEPQLPLFRRLVSLQIIDCDSLKNLFSLSVATHLRQLKLLKLYGCDNMEEVFVGEEGSMQQIILPEVECLILKHLPSLVYFYRQKITFNWPKLQVVRLSDIPKMKTFSQGKQITPLLKSVYVTFIEKCWQGDLNSTIQYLNNSAEFELHKGMEEGTSGNINRDEIQSE